ncbi:MAG: MBL fold metallo-hydrolase [Oscillospiraceae bacterium]|nr:MBL fold metallo-hydrolase [Oscillospiraceae bacterium]
MHRHINCIAHNSSEGRLLIGDAFTAIVDCGMAFCAGGTIGAVKEALNGRPLDYVLLTHTHYDHVGALPYFRDEWPSLRLVTCAVGAAALQKETPRRVIRELAHAAAGWFGVDASFTYSDDAFRADIIVKEGDIVELGGISAHVMETPGHTRDSLCYKVPELDLLMLNETPGVLMPDGSMYPCYLTGFGDTMESIKKCRASRCKVLSLPHRGVVGDDETLDYFDKAEDVNNRCHDLILGMLGRGCGEAEIIQAICEKYLSGVLLTFQPREAFEANARAIYTCTKREITNV